jgi:hypothetical protein
MPDRIMRGYMTTDDIADMTKILRGYKNLNIGWDEYRAKIKNEAEDLLDVWIKVVNECWKNGFTGPEVVDGKIRWYQVLGSHNELSDEPCWK